VVIEEGAVVGYPSGAGPVILGDNSHIYAGAIIHSGCRIGANSHVYHHTVLLPGSVIGNYTKIGSLCVTQGNLTIGDWVTVASHCHLTSGMVIEDGAFLAVGINFGNANNPGGRLHRHSHMKAIDGPRIERGARIGAGVTVNPGVVIGQEAFIGTGSVVTRSIPPFSIAFGSPAKVKGTVDEADRIPWDSLDLTSPNPY
jgi:acetyltransferase-like isoleucine patch superfamily enzyme